jgi:hypothetical protein
LVFVFKLCGGLLVAGTTTQLDYLSGSITRMELIIKGIIKKEICHFASPDRLITSAYRKIFVQNGTEQYEVKLPPDIWWQRLFAISRLARRALRLDKCNVVPVGKNLVIIRRGKVYHYDRDSDSLAPTLNLTSCRNVLHQSILVLDDNELYFGEYSHLANRDDVHVYHSEDGGRSWETIFVFPKGKIKHVHGCYYDPYEEKIWVLTGDFKDECYLLCADRDFKNIEWIGDGQQDFRACNVFFEQDAVHWVMDSQLQDSYHIKLDRRTRTIQKKQMFPGPVWYIKRLSDGYYLAATAQEIGAGVHDKYAHLFVSKDLENWSDVFQVSHEGLPKRHFKFGVIGFADGDQSSPNFYIFAEALRGIDGKILVCEIQD